MFRDIKKVTKFFGYCFILFHSSYNQGYVGFILRFAAKHIPIHLICSVQPLCTVHTYVTVKSVGKLIYSVHH